jgi:hypothetical protein
LKIRVGTYFISTSDRRTNGSGDGPSRHLGWMVLRVMPSHHVHPLVVVGTPLWTLWTLAGR